MIKFVECHEVLAKERILLIGEVQSGKTQKIFQIINDSADQNFNFCIFFGGTSNLLNNQSFERGKKYFQNKKIKFYNISQIKNVNFNVILHEKNFFPVIVVLKSKDKLNYIQDVFFDSINLNNKKVLIVDDESDYASINTDKEQSRIYKLILAIYNKIHDGKLVSVTATPFANILAKTSDPLYPNKLVFLPTNSEYTGINFFNNKFYEHVCGDKHNKSSWEDSIRKTIDFWIISSVKYELYLEKNITTELLINIDVETPSHDQIKKICLDYIYKIKTYYSGWKNDNETYKNEIINNRIFCRKQEILDDKIMRLCLQVLKNKWVFSLNSKSNEKTAEWKTGKYKFSIIIGGHLLSRGVTFEHLLTELILNAPQEKACADTMLQRARWFGYRKKDDQYKFMKIFMNKKTINSYVEIGIVQKKLEKLKDKNIFLIREELINLQKKLKYVKLTGKEKNEKSL